jgi:potassium efflux system protein
MVAAMNDSSASLGWSQFLGIRLFDIGANPITVSTVATLAIVVGVGYLVSRGVSIAVQRTLEKRGLPLERAAGPARVASLGVRAIAVIAALQTAGIDLASLVAAGAVFAVGVGIAMQKVAENFVSGLILVLERTIRVGDVVEFDGRVARVLEMGVRATLVRTLDDEDIIVPNSLLTQAAVKNFTLRDRLYRLHVKVGVSYESDLSLVRRLLERVAVGAPWREQSKDPVVQLVDFGASSVDYEVSVWTCDVWQQRQSMSMLREAIWDAFKENGIVISFPQIDVHLDPPVSRAIASLGRAA